MRVMQSKFTKTNPTNFSNGVARARCADPGSAYVKLEIILFHFKFSMHDLWLAKGTLKNLINYRMWIMHFQGFHKRTIKIFDLICKLNLQKWIKMFIKFRYLKTQKCSWTHVRTDKMCAVDIHVQYVNV